MGITDMFSLAFVSLYSVIYINMFIYSDKQESDLKIKSNRLTATNDFWNLYSQDQLREVKKKKTNLKTLALLLQAEVVPFASIETFANGNTRCSVLYPMYRLSRHLKKKKRTEEWRQVNYVFYSNLCYFLDQQLSVLWGLWLLSEKNSLNSTKLFIW